MDRESALAFITSVSVVAGLFVALLLTRLESWRAAATSAAAQVRATQQAGFSDRDAALRAELHCWEVDEDMPIASSALVDLVVGLSAVATYAAALSNKDLAPVALILAAPTGGLFVLLIVAEMLFIGRGHSRLRNAPYATFKNKP